MASNYKLAGCTMPQCQTSAGCICERALRPIRLQMCQMKAAYIRSAGGKMSREPNAMVCAEDPCTYPNCNGRQKNGQ